MGLTYHPCVSSPPTEAPRMCPRSRCKTGSPRSRGSSPGRPGTFHSARLPLPVTVQDGRLSTTTASRTGVRARTFEGTIAQLGSGALLLGPNVVVPWSSNDACSARASSLSSSSFVRSITAFSGLDAANIANPTFVQPLSTHPPPRKHRAETEGKNSRGGVRGPAMGVSSGSRCGRSA